MAAGDISLNILIGATDNASGVIAGLAGSGALGGVATAALAAGTAIVGFGVAAANSAGSFQQGMLKVQALAGLTTQQMQSMSQSILALAPALGQTPQQLAQGLYYVVSAGVPASQAMNVLQLSAEAAATGLTDTKTVADGLTSAVNAFQIPWSQANNVMSALTATVTNGKMEWSNLATVIGIVSVTAHGSGISFTDAAAGLATLTDSGLSAQRASMNLDFLMRDVGVNASKVAASAKGMGLSFDLSSFQSMNLLQKLQYLQQITGGNQAEMLKLTGGAAGFAAAEIILANNGQLYSSILGKITTAYQAGDATQKAFAITQQGLFQQLAQLNAAWQVLLITVGVHLLPVLTAVAASLTGMISGFVQMMTATTPLSPTLSNIAGMFTIMGDNWGQFIAQLQSTLSGPLAQFGQLMGSLLPGFLSQFLRALDLVELAFITLAGGAATLVGPALQIVGQSFQGVQGAIEIVLNALEGQFLPALQHLVSAIAPAVASMLQWVASSGLIPALWATIGAVLGTVIGVLSGLINGLASIINFLRQNAAGVAVLAVAIGALSSVMTLFAAAAVARTILSLIQFGISMATTAATTVTSAAAMITTFSTMASMMITSLSGIVVSTLAVAGPFLLIGAIIAVVVVGIILVIKNWGTIAPWLQGVWVGVASFFQAAMTQIGQAVSAVVAWFNQWKTPIMIVGGAILTFLAPALIQAGVQAAVAGAQITASFIASLVKTGAAAVVSGAQVAASFVASLVKAGIQAVITGAQFVASLIPAIISFATTAIATAATAIPAMIAGFVSWAIAGWAAAAATIAATWPVLLIIVAIVALVAIIILLVTHWGQVVSFLQSTWQAFTTWFMGALAAIGAFFQNVWNAIATFFQGVWNSIVAFFQTAWNNMVNIVQTAITTVVNWFIWLYAHNYYFQDLVNGIIVVFTFLQTTITAIWTAITGFLAATWAAIASTATTVWNAIASFLQATWDAITSALTTAWNAISAFLQATWNAISSATMTAWNAILAFLQGVWNVILGAATAAWNAILGAIDAAWAAISGAVTAAANAVLSFLQGVWNSIVSTVTGMWGQISGIFASAWGTYISGPLGGLAGSIAGWFGSLVGQATAWGANLLQGFINGLLSMLGNLWGAVQQILGVIAKLLGFHSPTKEGEGRFITEWGKNMVKGFGQGIEAATPMLHAQIEHLIQPPQMSYAGWAGSAFALSASHVIHVHIEPGEAHVHLDKREVGHAVMDFAAKELRTQGVVRR